TLEPGGKLSVTQTNGQGGSITTTLASNGKGGVNVEASAHDVQLGGYLVDGGKADPGGPVPVASGGSAQPDAPGGAGVAPFAGMPNWSQPVPATTLWNAPQIPASPTVPADPLGSPADLLGA
ncbi:MAG: hypothetical protein ABI346_07720, partial [Candidatus Baltobacteraceae bacterium]